MVLSSKQFRSVDLPVDVDTFSGEVDDIKLHVSDDGVAALIDGCLFIREECGG